jgi:hypothetical protein
MQKTKISEIKFSENRIHSFILLGTKSERLNIFSKMFTRQ